MKQSLLKQYNEYNRKKNEKWAIKAQKRRVKEDKQIKRIISLLESWGSSNLKTNGYWFHFNFGGHYFSIVNQEDRVVGYCHKVVYHSDEKEMMEKLHVLEYDNEKLFDDISCEYKYSTIYINGDAVRAIKTLLKSYAKR